MDATGKTQAYSDLLSRDTEKETDERETDPSSGNTDINQTLADGENILIQEGNETFEDPPEEKLPNQTSVTVRSRKRRKLAALILCSGLLCCIVVVTMFNVIYYDDPDDDDFAYGETDSTSVNASEKTSGPAGKHTCFSFLGEIL